METSNIIYRAALKILCQLHSKALALDYHIAGKDNRRDYAEIAASLFMAHSFMNQLCIIMADRLEEPLSNFTAIPYKVDLRSENDIYHALAQIATEYNNVMSPLPVKSNSEVVLRNLLYSHLIRTIEITKQHHGQTKQVFQ